MCGLWASFRVNATESVIDVVRHRGPDGRGWLEVERPGGRLALGHCRLAIIDTRTVGTQPMSNGDGRYTIVYNGELYNFAAMRSELMSHGETFTTDTDTEVVLCAYKVWGVDCLRRFHGMFAFVIFDSERDEVVVVRDRFGIKPLFWALHGGGIVFASEMKQILALDGFAREVNTTQAYDFLAYGMLYHTNETLFRGIHQVPAGSYVILSLKPEALPIGLSFKQWFSIIRNQSTVETLAGSARRVSELLEASVAEHMVADVDIGFSLSGGIDSSVLTMLGHKFRSTNKTFSAVFDDPEISEERFIREVNRAVGTTGHLVVPSGADFAAKFGQIIHSQETPITSASVFSQWSVYAAAAAEGVKVMLDGQGADEYFGGYHAVLPYQLAGLLRSGRIAEFVRTLFVRRRELGLPLARQILACVNVLLPGSWRAKARKFRGVHMPAWMGNGFKSFHSPLPNDRSLMDILYSQTRATSLPKLLHCLDRNSMSHGIEARVPMLDADLVSYVFSLPDCYKIDGAVTKRVLRDSMKNRLPTLIYERRDKAAFATPEAEWTGTTCGDVLHREILALPMRMPGYFNQDGIQALLDRHADPDAIWRLASFSVWLNTFDVRLSIA